MVTATTATASVRSDPAPVRSAPAAANGPAAYAVAQAPTAPVASAARATPPVAEQIGGAIAARVEVSPSEGRIDFHLTLNPPELGQVRVQLTLTNQTLSARLVAQDGATRQLIQSQMDSLRQRLQDTGLGLGQLDVSGGGGGNGGRRYEPLQPFADLTGGTVPQAAPAPVGAAGGTATGLIDLVA
jgi:flagellar hook-length control protein FliK